MRTHWHQEPTLNELFDDPAMKLLLTRDQVSEQELRRLGRQMRPASGAVEDLGGGRGE